MKTLSQGWWVLVFILGAFTNIFGPPFVFIAGAFINPTWTLGHCQTD